MLDLKAIFLSQYKCALNQSLLRNNITHPFLQLDDVDIELSPPHHLHNKPELKRETIIKILYQSLEEWNRHN